MRIAILGATSQIARDLIVSFCAEPQQQLYLFARRPSAVLNWLASAGMAERYPVQEFSEFGKQEFDAVINFVGVGNPAQAAAIGHAILDITLRFDELVLNYLQKHPTCRYLFLSSGAAYGSSFNEPVCQLTVPVAPTHALAPHEWYGAAKFQAECRHRARPELSIIDIRVFNYCSRTQDLDARFLISDILRAIRDKTVLETSAEYIVRDYVHPSDFFKLINLLLAASRFNKAIDCYSRLPIDKWTLLAAMEKQFGLRYEIIPTQLGSASSKPYYFSLNRFAADIGYEPGLSSLEGIMQESEAMLYDARDQESDHSDH